MEDSPSPTPISEKPLRPQFCFRGGGCVLDIVKIDNNVNIAWQFLEHLLNVPPIRNLNLMREIWMCTTKWRCVSVESRLTRFRAGEFLPAPWSLPCVCSSVWTAPWVAPVHHPQRCGPYWTHTHNDHQHTFKTQNQQHTMSSTHLYWSTQSAAHYENKKTQRNSHKHIQK